MIWLLTSQKEVECCNNVHWIKALDFLYSKARFEFKLVDIVVWMSSVCFVGNAEKWINFNSCRKQFSTIIESLIRLCGENKWRVKSSGPSNLGYRSAQNSLVFRCKRIQNNSGFHHHDSNIPPTLFCGLVSPQKQVYVHIIDPETSIGLMIYAPWPEYTQLWYHNDSDEAQALCGFYLNLINREYVKLLIIKSMLKLFVIPYALPSKFSLVLSKYVKPACNQTLFLQSFP